jgi:hypothetical protein
MKDNANNDKDKGQKNENNGTNSNMLKQYAKVKHAAKVEVTVMQDTVQ